MAEIFQQNRTNFGHPVAASFGRVTKFTVGGYNNCQWGNEPSTNVEIARVHRFLDITETFSNVKSE